MMLVGTKKEREMKMNKFTLCAIATALAVLVTPHALAAELPQSVVVNYSGTYGIPASMTFTRSGHNYKVVSDIKVPLYRIRFESGGTMSGNTLKPSYYKDIRNGKIYAQAQFNGSNVMYGRAGQEQTTQVSGPVMDLFTLAWQLAANDAKLPENLKITNGKKIYNVGRLSKVGSAAYSFRGGKMNIDQYRVHQGDNVINYSFAPALNNIPAQINYSDDGKTYKLNLTSVIINGNEVKLPQ